MKNQREFLSELYENRIVKLPFIEYFQKNKDLRNKLFAEYLNTELQPNLNLYTNKYFTDKEIQNKIGAKKSESKLEDKNIIVATSFYYHTKFERRLREINREFYKKVSENSLEEKYKSHQLDKTEIFKKLTSVDKIIEIFKDEVLNENQFKIKEEADEFTKTITIILEDIDISELTKLVLNDFINDNENIKLELAMWNDTATKQLMDKYIKLKHSANNNIKEYLKGFDNVKGKKNKKPEIKELVSLFEHTSKYNTIMDILVSKNCIHKNTNIWNEIVVNKTLLVSLIQTLYGKGYYKDGFRPTNPSQIIAICQNTFRCAVSISTAKKSKPNDIFYKFIPLASELK